MHREICQVGKDNLVLLAIVDKAGFLESLRVQVWEQILELTQLKLKNGLSIYGLSGDLITERIKKYGIYEPLLYSFIDSYLKQFHEANCVDVGANIGNHTLTMSKNSKQVYAFEPVPFIYQILEKNLYENNISNVTTINSGLSDGCRKANIQLRDPKNVGTASVVTDNENSSKPIEIDLITGDSVLADHSGTIDFIKIDVEGHETEVLMGLKETIDRFHPTIVIEWNDQKTKKGFAENNLFENLLKDYSKLKITNNYDALRIKLSRLPLLKLVSSLLRLLYKTIKKEYFCLSPNPDLSKNHSCLLLIPNNKEFLVEDYKF